jgi:peroxiredoxin Q/BCP
LQEFADAGAQVFGISKDSVASHDKFAAKHSLTVPLLSDEESDVCEKFGVWKEKSMYGKKFWGIERSTFLIDGEGRIAREWRKVKVPGHAEEVLDAAKAL